MADLADFLAYQSHPDVLMYAGHEPMDEAKAALFLASQEAAQGREKGCYHAFAVYHGGDDRVIGDVGFYLGAGPEHKGDLGFQFHPAYHGQGYATEATKALLKYGFLELGLHRVTSSCDARNSSSFRLLERLGMRREAHFKQSRLIDGNFYDEYAYALLREEWLAENQD